MEAGTEITHSFAFEANPRVARAKASALRNALRKLGLDDRFEVPKPQPVIRTITKRRVALRSFRQGYNIQLVDRRPGERADNIDWTALKNAMTDYHVAGSDPVSARALSVAQAPEKPQVPEREEEVRGPGRPAKVYEALGTEMTAQEWADAVGVSPASIRLRLREGATMEEIVTHYALKKAG